MDAPNIKSDPRRPKGRCARITTSCSEDPEGFCDALEPLSPTVALAVELSMLPERGRERFDGRSLVSDIANMRITEIFYKSSN